MKINEINEGLTFDDVLLVPQKSVVVPSDVSVSTKLTDTIKLNIPVMSAAMDTVTEARLAIAIAREGGIGIIHKNMSIDEQASNVDKVKRSEHGVITDPFSLSPEHLVSDANALMAKYRISGVPITENGKLVGILTNRDLRFETDYSRKISEVMTSKNLVTAPFGTTLAQAQEILGRHKIEKLPLVDADGMLQGLITIKDIEKAIQYPQSAKDANGRLLAGAALGTTEDVLDRAAALVDAKVDIVTIDSAHGHSKNVLDVVEKIKRKYPDLQIIAGNVADTGRYARSDQSGGGLRESGHRPRVDLHDTCCGRYRCSTVYRCNEMRGGSGKTRRHDHRGRRHQVLRRHHESAGGRRSCGYDRQPVGRHGGEPRRHGDISGQKLQGLPRYGVCCCDAERQQGPVFPGEFRQACAGRRGGPRTVQRCAARYDIPAHRRPEIRHGILRRWQR